MMIQIDGELNELSFTKLSIRLHLRDVYGKLLKDREDILLENGLTWIIKAYCYINENPPIELFPKILDSESIDFLLEQSKLDSEFIKMTSLLKQKQKEFFKAKIKDHSFTNQLMSSGNHTSFLTERFEYFKKLVTKTHKESLRNEDFERLKVLSS